jgi:hypothetical protein
MTVGRSLSLKRSKLRIHVLESHVMLQIILFTLENLIYSRLLFKLYHFDLFCTEFSFVLLDGQDLSNTPQDHWWTFSSLTAGSLSSA